MLKNKLKFLIPLSSFCLLISTPLVAASCRSDKLTYDRYLLKSKTENGLDVLREHSPNSGSFSTESLWDTSSLFSILKQKHINDDNFKAKYSNEFKEIDQIKKQYYQNYNKFSDSEKKVMLDKIEQIEFKIADDWQKNNIALNKNKIFYLINSLNDLNKQQTRRYKEHFKDFDFSSKSILLVNGLDSRTIYGPVVRGVGYWIKNLTIVNNTINIEFEYKYIKPKENTAIAGSPVLSFSSTVHLVVVDKIQSLDNYQINVTNL